MPGPELFRAAPPAPGSLQGFLAALGVGLLLVLEYVVLEPVKREFERWRANDMQG